MNRITNHLALADLFGASAAVVAAAEAGIFRALLEAPESEDTLAARLGLDARATGRVLGVLGSLGFVEQQQGRWYASPAARRIAETIPRGWDGLEQLFLHTRSSLKNGEPIRMMDGAASERRAAYEPTVASLGKLFDEPAEELAQRLPVRQCILDVGAGSGVWSLAQAARDSRTRVTALDLPGVVDRFRQRAEARGLGERVATIVGDVFDVAIPVAAFDRVIVANVLHLEPAERAAELVARVAPALAPGGELVVVDSFDSEESLAGAVYALNLSLRTKRGTVHAEADVRRFMQSAGLRPGELVRLASGSASQGALLAHAH